MNSKHLNLFSGLLSHDEISAWLLALFYSLLVCFLIESFWLIGLRLCELMPLRHTHTSGRIHNNNFNTNSSPSKIIVSISMIWYS